MYDTLMLARTRLYLSNFHWLWFWCIG